jgi:hypothetical protein
MKLFPLLLGLGLFFASAITNQSATIGSFIWNDLNRNGIQDSNEPGLAGVTIELLSCNDSNVLATLVTTNDGRFTFEGSFTSNVFLQVELPAGFQVSTQNVGTNDVIDSDFDASGRTECFTIDCADPAGTNCIQTNFAAGLFRSAPGVASPGFWKNHLSAWPVTNIVIGGSNYTAESANRLMSNGDDKSLTMFRSLMAARLNELMGNDANCITQTLAQAEEWLIENPRGSNVRASSEAWKEGEELHLQLDTYNNGRLCAPKREDSAPIEIHVGNGNGNGRQNGNEGNNGNGQTGGINENQLRLRLITTPGQVFTIQESSNLVQWVSVGTVTNYFGILDFLIEDFTAKTNFFYRVVVLPEQAGTVDPVNVFGAFLELENDQRVELLPIVYDGDLVIRGNNNKVIGSGVAETVIAGNVIIYGNANTIQNLTVLGDVTFHGNGNTLTDVDYQGEVFDTGNENNEF